MMTRQPFVQTVGKCLLPPVTEKFDTMSEKSALLM